MKSIKHPSVHRYDDVYFRCWIHIKLFTIYRIYGYLYIFILEQVRVSLLI